MYEKTGNIVKLAQEKNTAAIGFICQDYIMARSVVYAAEATGTPAIVMLFPEHVTIQKTTGFREYAAMVKELADEVSVPVGLHCDHDYSYEAVMHTVECGFDSVMMDGSTHDLDTNIAMTKKVVDAAHELGAFVEGEIGHVGLASDADQNREDLFTKPEAAEKFCRESGVDSLAVSIGNAHGEYKETPHLDIERLEAIRKATDVPLVLHGGSGIPDDQLLVAFSKGINKFNLGTDYLKLYFKTLTEFTVDYAEDPDPVKVINMPQYVQKKLQPFVEDRLKTLCRF